MNRGLCGLQLEAVNCEWSEAIQNIGQYVVMDCFVVSLPAMTASFDV